MRTTRLWILATALTAFGCKATIKGSVKGRGGIQAPTGSGTAWNIAVPAATSALAKDACFCHNTATCRQTT